MQQEIEAKFLAVDHALVREQLQLLGAERVYPMRLMRRRTFDYPDKRLYAENAWVRLRDEGDKVELMLKQSVGSNIGDIRETPVIVSNYEAATDFLLSIGLVQKSEQESKRELWKLDDVEIMLDEWPWVKPFMEIEANNEQKIKAAAEHLGLSWDAAIFDTIEPVYYHEYDVTKAEIHALTSMKFSDTKPNWPSRRKK